MADKVVNTENQIWSFEEAGVTKIGFTSTFLACLNECWHILPAHNKKAEMKSPLLCVETNDGLISIESPCTGDILEFNDMARNFPDKLSENCVVLLIGKAARPVASAAIPVPPVAPRRTVDLSQNIPVFSGVDAQLATELMNEAVLRQQRAVNEAALRQRILDGTRGVRNVPPPAPGMPGPAAVPVPRRGGNRNEPAGRVRGNNPFLPTGF